MLDGVVASTDDDRAEELPDALRCLGHIASSMATHRWNGGSQTTLGTLIAIAARRAVMADEQAPTQADRDQAQDVLASYGLRLYPDTKGAELAVANDHRGLAGIFERTHWQARSGASGVWRQALLRVPGARPSPSAVRFRGPQCLAVLVPLHLALGDLEPPPSHD